MGIAFPLIFDGAGEAFGSRSRPRAAQHGLFQRINRLRLACEFRKRMPKKREQRNRREPFGGDGRHEPREPSGFGLSERNAGGIVDGDIPAGELGGDAPCQCPIRRDEGGGDAFRL
jgi:hypothetical protein